MKSYQEMLESLHIAFSAIKANKSRGILTTLGIVIGIVAVVTTMTAANGLGNRFKESISAIGSDVLYVSRMPWVMTGNFFAYRNRQNLELSHANKLQRNLRTAVAINPTTNTARRIKYQSTVLEDIDVIGTTDKHTAVSNFLPETGRFLTSFDFKNKKKVCVIGSEIKERLFEDTDPLNKKMKIGRASFLVVEDENWAGQLSGCWCHGKTRWRRILRRSEF
jgi:putative ABC transport system permease protein